MVNAFLAEKTGKFWVIDSICFLVPVYLFIVLYTNERIVDKSLTFYCPQLPLYRTSIFFGSTFVTVEELYILTTFFISSPLALNNLFHLMPALYLSGLNLAYYIYYLACFVARSIIIEPDLASVLIYYIYVLASILT